jgi:microcystin-dependent protein
MKKHAFGLLLITVAMATAPFAKAQSFNFLGEIKYVGFNFAPSGWALCNGQILPIAQNTALFSLLGTFYGGDGVTTFALPNLQGRMPLHQGNGYVVGGSGGQSSVTLTVAQMPKHHHQIKGSSATANSAAPAGDVLANTSGHPVYNGQKPDVTLNVATVTDVGGSQPVATMPPYLTVNCIIALQGIYPSRD